MTLSDQQATGGGENPPSFAFKTCPGCSRPFYSGEHACDRCRYRYAQRTTCRIGICIDCHQVVPWPTSERCRSCADLVNYATNVIPYVMSLVEKREYHEHWDQSEDRQFREDLYAGLTHRSAPSRIKHGPVCAVPTCRFKPLYASKFCFMHDEDLNGPLPFIVARGRPALVARCINCRIPTTGFLCPYHGAEMPKYVTHDHTIWTVHNHYGWKVTCPVCNTIHKGEESPEAWKKYAEHHILRHKEVVLIAA